jgi:hypothetical protein
MATGGPDRAAADDFPLDPFGERRASTHDRLI